MKLLILLTFTSCGYENVYNDWAENIADREGNKLICRDISETIEEYNDCLDRRTYDK